MGKNIGDTMKEERAAYQREWRQRKKEGKPTAVKRQFGKGPLSTVEARREYQRRYYQDHKEKAQEYQRLYNKNHKKSNRDPGKHSVFERPREAVRLTFNSCDLMGSPVEKTIKMVEKIIAGDRLFTM